MSTEDQHEDVKKFIDEELDETEKERLFGKTVEEKEAPKKDEEEVVVPPKTAEAGQDFNSIEMFEKNIEKALPDIEVTEREYENFEESVLLNRVPFSTTIARKGRTKEFKFTFRARMLHEYRLIYGLVADDMKKGLIPDYPALLTQLQELSLAVMLQEVNENQYDDKILPDPAEESAFEKGLSYEDRVKQAYAYLRKYAQNKLKGASQNFFVLALSALRDFEAKCYKISTELSNRPFSEPGE